MVLAGAGVYSVELKQQSALMRVNGHKIYSKLVPEPLLKLKIYAWVTEVMLMCVNGHITTTGIEDIY